MSYRYLRQRCAATLILLLGSLFSLPLLAQEAPNSARCRTIRAEASSEAWLLNAPKLRALALRIPEGGEGDGADTTVGDAFQGRIDISYSPIDAVRATYVMDTADAACSREHAQRQLMLVLEQGVLYGRLSALSAEVSSLESGLVRIGQIVDEATRRHERGIITVIELDELRLQQFRIQRRVIDIHDEIATLSARGFDRGPDTQVRIALQNYERASEVISRKQSALRRLGAWGVGVRAGLVPSPRNVDWYGTLEFSYNIGELWQRDTERRYLEARRQELISDEMEMRSRVFRFRQAMQSSVKTLGEALELAQAELTVIEEERRRLQSASTDNAAMRIALLEIRSMELSARCTFLQQLVATRRQLEA